jgi:hypothetical protein
MKRRVQLVANKNSELLFDIIVEIVTNKSVKRFVRNSYYYCGTVEYTDDSYLDVYYSNGEYFGIEDWNDKK